MSPYTFSNLPESNCGPQRWIPIWSCSEWGLHCHEPLPVARCALTAPFHPYLQAGGLFSAALSVGSRLPGVTWHSALWSPDFPLPSRKRTNSDCLVNSPALIIHRIGHWWGYLHLLAQLNRHCIQGLLVFARNLAGNIRSATRRHFWKQQLHYS